MDSIHNSIESAISANITKYLEMDLSFEDRVSMNFLLYERLPEVQYYKKNLSEFHNKTFVMNFFTWAVKVSPQFWKMKFVESLLIIQAYETVHNLGLNITTLKNYFLPKRLPKSLFVHPIRKVLYVIAKSLTPIERANLIQSIIDEGKCSTLETDKFDVSHLEYFLWRLIDLEYIKLGTWGNPHDTNGSTAGRTKSNIQNFAEHLKKFQCYQLYDCLIISEKLVNGEIDLNGEKFSSKDDEKMIKNTDIMIRDSNLQNISLNSNQFGYLECNLEVFEKLSMTFLLFDNAAEARNEFKVTNVVLQANKNIKNKYFYNCEINLFSKWILTFPKDWKKKLIECLLIIRNEKNIQCLGLNSFMKHFILPELFTLTAFIHPVKKILYYMAESLTEEMRESLIDSISVEETKINKNIDCDTFEGFLLKLIELKYIIIGSWNDSTEEVIKADVQKLANHLKRQDLYYFYEKLLDSEIIVNANLSNCTIIKSSTISTMDVDLNSKYLSLWVGLFDDICFNDFFIILEEYQLVSIMFLLGLDIQEQERIFQTTETFNRSNRMMEYVKGINQWTQNIENPQCYLVESLVFIQAYDHIARLGLDIKNVRNYFLPDCLKKCFFIRPLNKVIHEICKTLTAENKMTLVIHIKKLRENYDYGNDFCVKYCELFLLKHIVEENKTNSSFRARSASSNVQGLIKFFEKEKFAHQLQLLISSETEVIISKFRENFEHYMKRNLLLSNTNVIYSDQLKRVVSIIDYDILCELENKLQIHEKISLVFLLYDDSEEALKRVKLISQTKNGKRIDTLKCYEYNMNLLSDWASKNSENWREIILESIFTVQASRQIKELKSEYLYNCFLPKCIEKKNFIHPIKKALYLMCESLTLDCKTDIIESILSEKNNTITVDTYDEKYFELFILKLINNNYITLSSRIEGNTHLLNRKDLVPSNLGKLIAHLTKHNCTKQSTGLSKSVTLSNQKVEKFVYRIQNNKNMGIVLIIDQKGDHKMCQHTDEQESCDADRMRLIDTWKSFGFDPLIYENLDGQTIISTLKETVSKVKQEHSAFVFCVLARGLKGDIYGTDDSLVKIDDVEEVLHCAELRGKPKIIIVASREGEQIAQPMSDFDIPEKADVLNLSSNVNNLLTCYERGKGTKFIQTICSNLKKSGNLMSLMKIWLDVNAELTKWSDSEQEKECSFITTSFRKYLYLQRIQDEEQK